METIDATQYLIYDDDSPAARDHNSHALSLMTRNAAKFYSTGPVYSEEMSNKPKTKPATRPTEVPTLDELECLILWPRGSVGWSREMDALRVLLHLCELDGFGRIPQMAEQIREIWYNKDRIKDYRTYQKRFLKTLAEAGITGND